MQQQSNPEIARALRAVLDGNIDAYESVVAHFQQPLRSFMLRCAPDAGQADDLAQTTFLTAFERLERFQPDGDFGAWLFGIARNLVRQAWEKAQGEARHLSSLAQIVRKRLAERSDSAGDLDRADRSFTALRQCIDALPEAWRSIVALHYEQKQPIQAISERLGNSASTVGVTLFRTRTRLKDCLERRLSRGDRAP